MYPFSFLNLTQLKSYTDYLFNVNHLPLSSRERFLSIASQ
jgi:hypothetical protein